MPDSIKDLLFTAKSIKEDFNSVKIHAHSVGEMSIYEKLVIICGKFDELLDQIAEKLIQTSFVMPVKSQSNNQSTKYVNAFKVVSVDLIDPSHPNNFGEVKSNAVTVDQKYKFHKEQCDKLNSLYISKNTDYNDSFAKGIDSMGYASALVRMEDKLNRVKSLLLKNGDSKVDESVQDTLIDLANYSLMLLTEYTFRSDSEK